MCIVLELNSKLCIIIATLINFCIIIIGLFLAHSVNQNYSCACVRACWTVGHGKSFDLELTSAMCLATEH